MAVVVDDLGQDPDDRVAFDLVVGVDLDRPAGGVAVSLVDDAVGVADGGVVEEQVDVVLRRQEGADVAVGTKYGWTVRLIVSSIPGSVDQTISRSCSQIDCCQSGSFAM